MVHLSVYTILIRALMNTPRNTTGTSRGFTLIELLVVISIIGLLASVVLASLTSARLKARDAKRVSDLHQVTLALELYASTNGGYPARGGAAELAEITGALVPNYFATLPTDPTNPTGGAGYRYCSGSSSAVSQSYTLLAILERTNNWCDMYVGTDECGWYAWATHC